MISTSLTSPSLLGLAGSLLLVTQLGCEPMTPSANPFVPVKVVEPSASGVAPPAAVDPRFADFQEPQSISFEELQAMAPEVLPAVEQAPSPALNAPGLTGSGSNATASPLPSSAPLAPRSAAAVQGFAWAVRLVATVPDAQPPRAILGLPDGREIVVEPATLIPEVGLAVIAIGTGTVQLARFTANGDHATVESVHLTPQF